MTVRSSSRQGTTSQRSLLRPLSSLPMERARSTQITKDDVVAKLKDDGDFDNLRLKIIRKLKENEELRNNISLMVKESGALNRAGSENMKPRQLSDAIYDEVGSKVMSQISDGLWAIIRSPDGMKTEITETVQSVYDKLVNPKDKEEAESASREMMPNKDQVDCNGSLTASTDVNTVPICDGEPKDPPSFLLPDDQHHNNPEEQQKNELQAPLPHEKVPTEEQKEEPQHSQEVLKVDDINTDLPPSASEVAEHSKPCDGSDEDPEVPPGFG